LGEAWLLLTRGRIRSPTFTVDSGVTVFMNRLRAAIAHGRSRASQLLPLTRASGRARATAVGLLVLVATALLTTAADLHSPIRLALTIAAVLTAPGWSITAYLLPLPPSMEWTLSVAFSLVGSIAIATVMLLTGWWFPGPVMVGYLFLTGVAVAVQLLRPLRRSAHDKVETSGPNMVALS